MSPKDETWTRPNLSKKLYEKIDKYAKKQGMVSGKRLLDQWMNDFIDKHNL